MHYHRIILLPRLIRHQRQITLHDYKITRWQVVRLYTVSNKQERNFSHLFVNNDRKPVNNYKVLTLLRTNEIDLNFLSTVRLFSTTHSSYQVGYKLKNNVNDCYSLFNLPSDCSQEELRVAYLRLAKQYHPDSGSSTACPRKFGQIQDAYVAIKEHKNQESSLENIEDEETEGEFDFPHTLPQHRQYLGNEGIGFGSPSQRLQQFDKYKVRRAAEVVTEFQMSKNVMQTETSALTVNKKRARKNKISNTIERIVEDLIQESMSKGEFENLPGKGKPLDYTEMNPLVDTMTHNINKILINNGYAPEWILLEKEIREDLRGARERIAVEKKRIGDLPLNSKTDLRWQHHLKIFHNSISDLNEKIQRFNMIVPSSLIQKQMIPYKLEREIRRINEQCDEFLPLDYNHEDSGSPMMDSYIAATENNKIEWKDVIRDIKDAFRGLKSNSGKK